MQVRRTQGFTLVEMIVVIVVIAVLAAFTTTVYINVQKQARDTQLRDAADKVADAVQLYVAKFSKVPAGGDGSSARADVTTECTNGADGFFGTTTHPCTLEDTLVATGYLPAGFTSNLPPNTVYPTSGPVTARSYAIMAYTTGTSSMMIYYSMEDPSAADTANFNAQLTKCGLNPAGAIGPRDQWGMRNGICIQYSV